MTTTTTGAEAKATASKFQALRDFLESERGLIGRRTEMLVIEVAIAAKLHALLYGTPGVAKSMTVDGILAHLPGLRQFKTQAYKASPPEQFLGPISIKGMAEDRFVRITARRAADAEVFYCDEISRAPRALLPAFQGMMVEREFDAGDGVARVPLMSLIGTCNHIPDDPELEAFFDRFALKLTVRPPASQGQFVEILKGALRRRSAGEPAIPEELLISRDELVAFQRHVETVYVADPILEQFGELWSNLLSVGIMPSVRRYVDVTKAMQACAALDGRDEVLADDLQIAQHALWSNPDEAEAVYNEVVKFASEWVKKKAELLDSFAEMRDRLGQVQALVETGKEASDKIEIKDAQGNAIKSRDGSSLSARDHGIKVVNTNRDLQRLVEQHITDAEGRDTSELEAVLTQIEAAAVWVSDRLLGGLAIR